MITLIVIMAVFCYLVGWAWLLIAGFTEAVPWGVGILLFSPIALVFSLFHWPEYKVPTFMYLAGVVLYVLVIIVQSL
jgi:hypothetical protein